MSPKEMFFSTLLSVILVVWFSILAQEPTYFEVFVVGILGYIAMAVTIRKSQ